jgi:anthranilate phosphoribosyltransferase
MEEAIMLKAYIKKVINHQDLTQEEAFQAMQIIMIGGATPAQIGGYLVGLRMKGETVDEITGSASAMQYLNRGRLRDRRCRLSCGKAWQPGGFFEMR